MKTPYVRVIGSSDWLQEPGDDHSCYTVNDRVLVDACPSVVQQLLTRGIDPTSIKTVCFTHLHCDHYMGLAPLLFYWRVRLGTYAPFTIIGPKATIRAAVDRALNYIYHDSDSIWDEVDALPTIIEIEDEGCVELEDLVITTAASNHAVPGLCYRFTDKANGHAACFSGDTWKREQLGEFFADADLLIHECSCGAGVMTEENNPGGHSSGHDVVSVCKEAKPKRLLLTHAGMGNRLPAMVICKNELDIPVDWAIPGRIYEY